MIEKINDYSYKSFKQYSGPSDKEHFKRVNIIFGYNGRGKSALSKGIVHEFMKNEMYNSNNYRFFDKDYINNNILLEEGKSLKGIIANFGETNVDIEKEIIEKEKLKIDTEEINKEIQDNKKIILDTIETIFNSKKGNSTIKKKNASNINELVDAYKKDLKPAMLLVNNNEDELKNVKDGSQYEQEFSKIQNLDVINIKTISDDIIDNIYEILGNEYNDEKIPSTQLLEWLKFGISIHKSSQTETCEFCGGNIKLVDIEKKVNTYIQDKKQQDLQKLDVFVEEINQIISCIENLHNNQKLFSSLVGDTVNKYYENLNELVLKLGNYKEIVLNKTKHLSLQYTFEKEELKSIMHSINDLILAIKNEKESKLSELNSKIDKINTLIKGKIALEIRDNLLIDATLKKLIENEKLLEDAEYNNKQITRDIENLKNSKSNVKDFSEYLNILLEQLGIDFYLDLEKDNYILKIKKNDEILKLNDISEGEHNLLALLFFYYELFEDKKQQKFKNDIKLIVIDDPISSIDDVNKMYVLELIKNITELELPQIFILTHVWDDFCNLCYGKKDENKSGSETPYGFYEIKKNNTSSFITKAKTNETPYKHHFKEVYEFSQKQDTTNITNCEIYHYPNIMRKILEGYMSFKVAKSNPTRENINNVKIALCGDINKVSAQDNIQIPALLDVCNILSHKSTKNPDQILKSANYMMRKIKEIDNNHFSSMIN